LQTSLLVAFNTDESSASSADILRMVLQTIQRIEQRRYSIVIDIALLTHGFNLLSNRYMRMAQQAPCFLSRRD
jgi:hypothetical protein